MITDLNQVRNKDSFREYKRYWLRLLIENVDAEIYYLREVLELKALWKQREGMSHKDEKYLGKLREFLLSSTVLTYIANKHDFSFTKLWQ